MLKRMENYIDSVMNWCEENYPGVIYAWDVVNEAVDDAGGMRQSYWTQTIGEDYVEKAFEFARKHAPANVELFYNDYNEYQTSKQEDILKFPGALLAGFGLLFRYLHISEILVIRLRDIFVVSGIQDIQFVKRKHGYHLPSVVIPSRIGLLPVWSDASGISRFPGCGSSSLTRLS